MSHATRSLQSRMTHYALPITHYPSREAPDEFEHLLHVAGHLDAAPFAPHQPLAVDGEGAALDAAHLFAIHVFHLDDVEALARLLLRIGRELERTPHLGLEALVRFQAVARDAVDGAAELLEFRVQVAEVLAFRRASRGIVLRVEVENDGFALGAGQAEIRAAGGWQLEVGRWLVDHSVGGFPRQSGCLHGDGKRHGAQLRPPSPRPRTKNMPSRAPGTPGQAR